MKNSILGLMVALATAFLVFVFAYAAISKFLSFETYRYTLGHLPLIGRYSPVAVFVIPSLNLLAAILLLIPARRKAALLLTIFLLTGYSAYIGYELLTAKDLPCTCNGIGPWLSWTHHLWLNLIMISIAVGSLLMRKYFIAIKTPVPARTGNRGSRKPE